MTGKPALPFWPNFSQYDIVVPFSNLPFLDATALGDNLADYVDGGGVAVQYGFSHYRPDLPYGVNGRWLTNNYNPYSYTRLVGTTVFTMGSFNAGHPLMTGVTTLNSSYQNIVGPAAGATQVAAASNLYSLVAYRPASGGHTTVGVTAYVGDSAFQSGDWGKVTVNAGNWLHNCQVGGTPTPTLWPPCNVGPWQLVATMLIDLLGAAGASEGTYFYAAGGYSFANGGTRAVVNRYDPVADTCAPMAPMPQAAAVATAVYYRPTNKIYVFGGGNPDTFQNYNTTRIYDIASNTWSTGAPMPDIRSQSASGYILLQARFILLAVIARASSRAPSLTLGHTIQWRTVGLISLVARHFRIQLVVSRMVLSTTSYT